ncbi:MAG: hypothetical protein GF418_05385 [Chitinivibrionales bacterium]|nr:hypothetical protein [Chitinivibrionales bacterium]MBD3395044.1 hypothetical protein [Chitinivibrionales bacterium]
MTVRAAVGIVGALLAANAVGRTYPRGPNYDGVRSMGMGNTTVAVTTDRTAVFHNPAGLGLLKDKVDISVSPLVASADGEFVRLIKALTEQGHKLSDIALIDSTLIDTINALDGYWMGVQYIPEFTVAKKNLGFGMYTVWPVGLRVESGHFIPKLAVRGERDLVFTWAVGVPLRHDNHHFGISLEYVQRTPVEETVATYSETFILTDDIKKRPLGVLGDFANTQRGASFDIGFMHDWSGFRLAWDIKDIFGVVGGDIVFPPQLDVGCAYFFPQLEEVRAIRNLIVAMEFSDLVGFDSRSGRYEQFAKKVHLGAELDMHYVALRLGLSQGYPTAGIGLNLGMASLDYVYFTEEMGYFAGQLPRSMHVLSLSFGLRVAPREGLEIGGPDIEEPLPEESP